jgi:hypothetical protein
LSSQELLQRAFENIGAYVMNLDAIRDFVENLMSQTTSSEDALNMLETKLEEAEVTLQTDIRILLNEFRHLSTMRQSSQ